MYGAQVSFAGSPRIWVLETLLEAICRANTVWYLEQWEQGRDPPCCVECAGATWRPDRRAREHRYACAPQVLARPKAGWSCKELALVDCAAKRARAIRDGTDPERACELYYCVLDPQPDGTFHASVQTPDGIEDVTASLPRV